MGQAKLRGTFEERKAKAIEKYETTFRQMEIIPSKRKTYIPPELAAFWTIVAMVEQDARRQRAFFEPVKVKGEGK